MLPNKISMTMHILAYLVIIIVDASLTFTAVADGSVSLRAYKIAAISTTVVYAVCTLIFGLILNTIITKVQIGGNNQEDEKEDERLTRDSTITYSEDFG